MEVPRFKCRHVSHPLEDYPHVRSSVNVRVCGTRSALSLTQCFLYKKRWSSYPRRNWALCHCNPGVYVFPLSEPTVCKMCDKSRKDLGQQKGYRQTRRRKWETRSRKKGYRQTVHRPGVEKKKSEQVTGSSTCLRSWGTTACVISLSQINCCSMVWMKVVPLNTPSTTCKMCARGRAGLHVCVKHFSRNSSQVK